MKVSENKINVILNFSMKIKNKTIILKKHIQQITIDKNNELFKLENKTKK